MKILAITTGFGLFAVGCSSPESVGERIAITDDNELGAVAIQLEHFEDNGDKVFELRGLDASDNEVALVRLRVGTIADLSDHLPGSDSFGSELILSGGGGETRSISREVEYRHVASDDLPTIQAFIELSVVSSALEREAKILVHPATRQEAAYTFMDGVPCPASYMLSSPVAQQCCYTTSSSGPGYTMHVNASGSQSGNFSRRWGPSSYGSCKAAGGGTCNGSACYIGPAGFTRPDVFIGSGTRRVHLQFYIATGDYRCINQNFASNPPPVEYADVTGTKGTACGCACNGSGTVCYDSSKSGNCGAAPNCNTLGCSGGGSGAGQWNY